jgi:outer membrane biosynthesis protein TonB
VLIALLGGAALAGGLYFGGMGNFGGSAPQQQAGGVVDEPAADSANDYASLEEAPSVPLSDTIDLSDNPPPPTTRERPAQTAAREEAPPAPTANFDRGNTARTRTTSSTPPSGVGGPLSLSPAASSPAATTPQNDTAAAAPPPQVTTPQTTAASATTPSAATPREEPRGSPAGSVVWTQRPSARRIAELYPARALREGVGGRVLLDCTVQTNLALACRVSSETPAGEGFARAALSASNAYRARATLSDGTSAIGSTTRIAVNFQAPQQ